MFVFENVINFVPRICFWFKIDYALQLAVRFIVKIIASSEDSEEISGIIEANPGIAKFFCEYAEILEYCYKGGVVINHLTNEILNNQILAAMVEVLTVCATENHSHVMLMPEQHQFFGDNNIFFSLKKKNVNSVKQEWMKGWGSQK